MNGVNNGKYKFNNWNNSNHSICCILLLRRIIHLCMHHSNVYKSVVHARRFC